tara:strand:+ start:2003 stop:3274 length:1272 start_codon:yes stop_codon:yes gene_type:complete
MTGKPGYCRHCLSAIESDVRRTCPACGQHRLLRHDEINDLSIAHIDCDAFYAAIEKRDDPSLADKPVIIGGRQRGVVATCCYVARLYGVRSAMPMFQALKRCPDAVVISPRGSVYAEEGRRIREMMESVTPLVEPLSIDEAFLDLDGTSRLHGRSPALTLLHLQRRIFEETGLTVSVGLSFNKFLAKTASDLDKPDGFTLIGRAEAADFLKPRPVGSVFGVGPAFAARLQRDGIRKLADVLRHGDKAMAQRYGDAGLRLSQLARGEDVRTVKPDRERKSISTETTFISNIADKAELESRLWKLCEKTAALAKAKNTSGSVVTLKLKTAKFKSITRRRTLHDPTQLADTLYRVGRELLAPEVDGTAYRLIGIGLSGLQEAAPDIGDLLDPGALKRAAAERAMDKARDKFGGQAVIKGRALRRDP